MEACFDSRCQAICLENNMLAMEDCPCAANCPSGCDGCQSIFCGACEKPELDDVNYKVCVDKNSGELDFCLKRCSNDAATELNGKESFVGVGDEVEQRPTP